MENTEKRSFDLFGKKVELTFSEWLAQERNLPEGFAESNLAKIYWDKRIGISMAMYKYRLQLKTGFQPKSLSA